MEKDFKKDSAKKRGRPKKSTGGKSVQTKSGKQKPTGKKA